MDIDVPILHGVVEPFDLFQGNRSITVIIDTEVETICLGKVPTVNMTEQGYVLILSEFLICFDYGKTYVTLDNPYDYKFVGDTKEDRTGYSVCYLISPDGKSMYFFNNPQYGATSQTISVIKIEIDP